MHHITPYQPAVTLFGVDGSVRPYRTLRAALKALGFSWIRRNVGPSFAEHNVTAGYGITWASPCYAYIMRNEFGDVVLPVDFEALRGAKKRKGWNALDAFLKSPNPKGPVPHTGRGHHGNYYCHPHTSAERRLAALCLAEEGEVPPRAARNATNLINCWDDKPIMSRYNHNWKRYRRTRYKQTGGAQ